VAVPLLSENLDQIARKLTADGVAFLHHSNIGGLRGGHLWPQPSRRSTGVA